MRLFKTFWLFSTILILKSSGTPIPCGVNKRLLYPTKLTVVDNWNGGANFFLKMTLPMKPRTPWYIQLKLKIPMPEDAILLSWSARLVETSSDRTELTLTGDSTESDLAISFVIDSFGDFIPGKLIAYASYIEKQFCPEDVKDSEHTTDVKVITPVKPTPDKYTELHKENTDGLKKKSGALATNEEILDVPKITNEKPQQRMQDLPVIDESLLPEFKKASDFDGFVGDDGCPLLPSIEGETGIYTKQNVWSEGDEGSVFEAFINVRDYPLNVWTIKLVFSVAVAEIRVWNAFATMEGEQDGYVWYLTPQGYNTKTDHLRFNMNIKLVAGTTIPKVWLYMCNDGDVPSSEILIPPWDFELLGEDSFPEIDNSFGDMAFQETFSFSESSKEENNFASNTNEPEIIDSSSQEVHYVDNYENNYNTKKLSLGSKRQLPDMEIQPTPNPNCGYIYIATRNITNEPSKVNCKPANEGDNLKFDYNVLICMSIMFYEAQRSGFLPENSRIPWRGDSGVQDGCFNMDGTEPNLSGGWFDSKENNKYGFPMASATTVLAWGIVEFEEAYEDAGELENALDMLKWATDYFVNAHTADNELWGHVTGFNQGSDELPKTRPEENEWLRIAYKIDEENPGSDLAGETAAALAASSMVFRSTDPEYADQLLWHAEKLYQFADKFRGFYHDSIEEVQDSYFSFGEYTDEITWACIWVARAMRDDNLLDECEEKYREFNMQNQVPYEFSWALKIPGINILLAQLTEKQEYIEKVEEFFDHTLSFGKTPGGLTFVLKYGANRYAANLATIAIMSAKTIAGINQPGEYINYAKEQIHAMLGDGDGHRSYVVGFGENFPKHYNHLASACPVTQGNSTEIIPCTIQSLYNDEPNANILYGALVGGPVNARGSYSDSADNVEGNSVALDYNAGFQTAVAGLKYFSMKMRESSINE